MEWSKEVICFTGKSVIPRAEMVAMAKMAGASVVGAVTKTTTILVITDIESTTVKARKAREFGTKLMSPEDFLELIGD